MNVTAWASGLEVTGDGTGIVSHAGVGLLRRLADKTSLTRGLLQALFSGRLVHHDRGRVLADISRAIADGSRAVSDFRVLAFGHSGVLHLHPRGPSLLGLSWPTARGCPPTSARH